MNEKEKEREIAASENARGIGKLRSIALQKQDPAPGVTRVLLADEDPLTREAMCEVAARFGGFQLIAVATTGAAALAFFRILRPDVVVLDPCLRRPGGLAVIAQLVSMDPAAKILVFTREARDGLIAQCTEAGARGYALKQSGAAILLEAVARLRFGSTFFDPDVLEKLGSRLGQRGLSPRELGALRLASVGLTTKEIAASMGVGARTIEDYFARLFKKLQVRSRLEAIAKARADGLMDF